MPFYLEDINRDIFLVQINPVKLMTDKSRIYKLKYWKTSLVLKKL